MFYGIICNLKINPFLPGFQTQLSLWYGFPWLIYIVKYICFKSFETKWFAFLLSIIWFCWKHFNTQPYKNDAIFSKWLEPTVIEMDKNKYYIIHLEHSVWKFQCQRVPNVQDWQILSFSSTVDFNNSPLIELHTQVPKHYKESMAKMFLNV